MDNRNTRKSAFGLILGLIGFLFQLNAQGIEFIHDLETALKKAKTENKIVFVDFYTSWCAPCKVMSNEVFPQEKVGEFYNKEFINCKIQCDDNGIGVELGKKYKVQAYPTLMYLDKTGEEIHSAAGSLSADGLISLGKTALNPDKNMFSLIKEWRAGNRQEAFVNKYFKALKEAYRHDLLNTDFLTYFDGLSKNEKLKKSSFELVKYVNPAPFSAAFEYIETNKKDYYRSVGAAEVDKYIAGSYLGYLRGVLMNGFSNKDLTQFNTDMAKFKAKNYPYYDEYAMYYNVYNSKDANGKDDINLYMKRGTEFLSKYGKNNDAYVVSLCSLLGNYTGGKDKGYAGIQWMEELLKRNRNPQYLNTYFYILWRNHHWAEALEVGKEIKEGLIKSGQSTEQIDKQVDMVKSARLKYGD